MRPLAPNLALLVLMVAGPLRVAAQTTDAAFVGAVRDSAGLPLAEAMIVVRNTTTGFSSTVRSNGAGRFGFRQLPLGGPYEISARLIGYRAETRSGYELGLGTRVEVEFVLAPSVAELPDLEASVAEAIRDRERLGGATRLGERELSGMATVGRNFTDLVTLAPLASAQLAVDPGFTPQITLGGGRYTGTDVRLDGVQSRNLLRGGESGAGPYTVSLEAVREVEVVTNVYDAAQGRQAGGAVNAATKFGTNELVGSLFLHRRDDRLAAARDYMGRGRNERDCAVNQWGGSVGGAVVRDRLHFFVAFDRQDSREPLFIADIATPADEIEAGVAADSLARLQAILRDRYGASATTSQTGMFDRRPVANTLFTRLDWNVGLRHRLSLRQTYGDWRSPLSGGVDQPIALYESRSDFSSREHQLLAALRSTVSSALQTELRVAYANSRRRLRPNSDLPRGFVRIRSELPDGSVGDTRVQFGGNRLAPDDSEESQWQVAGEAFWQRGNVLATFGTDNSLALLRAFIANDQGGLFEFESLAELESGTASRFTRQLPLLERRPTTRQWVLDVAAFGQLEWRPSPRVTATVGLRWDATDFLTRPTYNPLVAAALGYRTDVRPSDWNNLQPRTQLTWVPDGAGRHLFRVGAGAFTAQAPYYAHHNALLNDGLRLADVSRVGSAAPDPDFPAYRSDPGSVPGLAAGEVAASPFVVLAGREFELPYTWKGSASYRITPAPWFALGVSLLASRTSRNYHYIDRNLRDRPAFFLAAEGGRGVFVPAASIDARGRTDSRHVRRTPELGRVLELASVGRVEQEAVVFDVGVTLPRDASLNASYTYNSTRDNSTFACCLAQTATRFTPVATDPRNLDDTWGASDTDFRHKVVAYATLPRFWGVRVGARYVGSTGRAYSLTVNGDINGDGSDVNDLAFVFDPSDPATPPEIAGAMRRVLNNPASFAGDYIRRNLGRVARRNGDFAPWVSRIDLRISKAIAVTGGQSVELIADVFNFANLLDSDWGGQYLLPPGISAQNPVSQRQVLLNVIGFDQATGQYRYSVNENVGVLRKGGDPYQIQLGVRYAF